MRIRWLVGVFLAGSVVVMAAPAAAAEFLGGHKVTIDAAREYAGDLYVAGAQVEVDGHIRGDLIVAGGVVTVRGLVDGDIIGLGGTITVLGPVGQTARLAGGEVKVASQVGGDLLMAGSRVLTEPTTTIYGETLARAGELVLKGDLGNRLHARGSLLTLAGTVRGPASVQAPQLSVTADTTVEGEMRVQTATPNAIAPGAKIRGGVDSALWKPRTLWDDLGSVAFRLFTALLVGVVLLWLAPGAARRTVEVAVRPAWLRMMLGLGVLIGGPLVAILVMITVIGLPLGMIMLGVYAVALYLSQVVIAWTVGRWILGRVSAVRAHWQQFLALTLGLVLLHLGKSIPVAGPYVTFMVVIWGLGALMTLAYESYLANRDEQGHEKALGVAEG